MNKTALQLNLHNMPRFIEKHIKLKAQLKAEREELSNDLAEMYDTLMAKAHKGFAKDVKHIEARLIEIFKEHNKGLDLDGYIRRGPKGQLNPVYDLDVIRAAIVNYIGWLQGKNSGKQDMKASMVSVGFGANLPGPFHKDYPETRVLALDYEYYRTKHYASDDIKKVNAMTEALGLSK